MGERNRNRYDLQPTPCPDAELIAPFSACYSGLLHEAWYRHPRGFLVFSMPCLDERLYWQECATNLPGIMALLREQFHLVLFNMPVLLQEMRNQELGERVLRLCDSVLLLINNTSEALPEVRKRITLLQRVRGRGIEDIKIGVSRLIGERGMSREALRADLGLAETPAIWVRRTEAALTGRIETEKFFPVQGPRACPGVRTDQSGVSAGSGWCTGLGASGRPQGVAGRKYPP